MDRKLIEQYAAGGPTLAKSIAGLSADELRAFPVPGMWSIQQVVMHLMDSDLIASDRMKRVIAEENPTIIGYNETLFSQRLFYDDLDAEVAADIFAKNRMLTAVILRKLPDSAYARTGQHNESGLITLEYLVKTYTEHLDNHMKHLREKRAKLGKPLLAA